MGEVYRARDIRLNRTVAIKVALDEVLIALTQIDERLGRIVEMKFFGGLNVERDRRSAPRVARYGQARLETGEGVVGTGASENQPDQAGWEVRIRSLSGR